MKSIVAKYLVGFFVVFLLTACGEEVLNTNITGGLGASEPVDSGPVVAEPGGIDNITVLSSGESQSRSLAQGEWKYYSIDTTADDTELVVELTNISSDIDLYLNNVAKPTPDSYNCVSFLGHTSETCTLPNSGATTIYIGVHGYKAGSFTIKATRNGQVTPESGVVTLSADSIDFGNQGLGGISDPLPLTVTNNSSMPLTISSITISSSDFIETNNCNDYLPAGLSCSFDIQFVPTTSGTITGALTITDSTTGSRYAVSLSGTSSIGTPSTLIASGPILISGEQNVVISGLRISNPNGLCIEILNNSTNIIIENSEIGPCNDVGIDVRNSTQVTIRNVNIHDTVGEALRTYASTNVSITQSTISYVRTGVYAVQSESINVSNNSFLNMQGPFPRGQLVQFNRVSGYGNRINNNIGINEIGSSYAEDAINLYSSSGVPGDPIQINNNTIVGGGPSDSGGGILVGDSGGSYTTVRNNILVDPGQYGISVAGGNNHLVEDNLVYAKQQSFTNVGLYVWDQYNSNCHAITVRGNQVNWANRDGLKNSAWNAGNCGIIDGWSDNDWNANIDASIASTP